MIDHKSYWYVWGGDKKDVSGACESVEPPHDGPFELLDGSEGTIITMATSLK